MSPVSPPLPFVSVFVSVHVPPSVSGDMSHCRGGAGEEEERGRGAETAPGGPFVASRKGVDMREMHEHERGLESWFWIWQDGSKSRRFS